MTNDKYRVTLTDAQVAVASAALELYCRLLIGQPEHVLLDQFIVKMPLANVEAARNLIGDLKAQVFPGMGPNTSHGIHSSEVSDDARVAFDIQQVLRHGRWLTRKLPPDWTSDAMAPTRTSTGQALPTIELLFEEG